MPVVLEMDTVELIQRLSVALAIGLLIGMERGWLTRDDAEGERAAGLRTHGLAGLLGGVWGAVAHPYGGVGVIALSIAFIFVGAVVAAYRYREIAHDGTFGATTVFAVMLAFSLGALAVIGDMQAAGAAAVAATAVLALKAFLHGILKAITWNELRSGIVLLAMTFILLPVAPNRAIDPWDAINPFEIWLMTVLIGVISFAGYVAVKAIGYRRGVAIAGLAGGLVSTTAATAAMSRLAKEHPEQINVLAAAAAFANMVMAPRVLAVASFVNAGVALRLAAPLVAAALVFGAGGLLLMGQGSPNGRDDEEGMTLGNPLDLLAVLKFGALLAAVMILSRIATHFAGSAGAYALAALAGIADVDAISLTMARLGATELGAVAAAIAIMVAMLTNTASKLLMAFAIGGAGMGLRLGAVSIGAVLAAALALWFTPDLADLIATPKS